ncbi:hypothetical protein GCM10027202_20660 [Microvirgula curvata]|uniref:EscE/YscE/SsaE family type III secretion system needle protein co-chaperone n=1 Tax=Microvirgula aerodenitrificans TaxID=57480 RepID=A0A2S0P901_9NEIS|nr:MULTISPECIES: EscE/YscE/SsaE family type III secretion system needle protein co-chaperone [Microvirgula]AVY93815.1 EscE/YscE/SsaE family type III secretion system needle protein co-chaperone [Microvirgula aerodenitrificans]RAS14223.1 type III secretion system YseE family protein [Microvirgula sp. AG722]
MTPCRLTRIEHVLHADRDGTARDRALEKLLAAERLLRQSMRQPDSRENHQAMAAQLDACRSAAQVIERLWRRHHGGQPPWSASHSR